jgi:hypothetical protein
MLVVVVLIGSFMPLPAQQQWCFFKISQTQATILTSNRRNGETDNGEHLSTPPVPQVFKPLAPLAFSFATTQYFLYSAPGNQDE